VKRTAGAAGRALAIQRLSLRQRAGIHRDDRVDRRPMMIVRVDAREVRLHQRLRGDRSS
jgi:hypothetical protein